MAPVAPGAKSRSPRDIIAHVRPFGQTGLGEHLRYSSASSIFTSLRSRVSKPSVNQA